MSSLRPTGLFEQFNIVRNHVRFYGCVHVSALYTVPKEHLTPEITLKNLIYLILQHQIDRHPILGVTVQDETVATPQWKSMEHIDLEQITKFIDADPYGNMDDIVQRNQPSIFDRLEELPLWRILVVAQQEGTLNGKPTEEQTATFSVTFCYHHAIGDGLSGSAFHLTFLESLNQSLSGSIKPSSDQATSLIPVPKLPLLPSLEAATDMSVSICYALKPLIKNFIYSSSSADIWSGPPTSATLPRPPKANYRTFHLPHASVKDLLFQCREQKTTLTALLTVLVAHRLAVMYPTHSRFIGTVPFSLRHFTKNTPTDIGLYVTAALPNFSSSSPLPKDHISTDPESRWDSARKFKRFLELRRAKTTNQDVGLLKFIKGDFKKFFMGRVGKVRGVSFELTNLGVVDGGAGAMEGSSSAGKEGVKKAFFDRVRFASGHCTYGTPYCVFVATAKGGDMAITTTWETGILEDEEAGRFVAGFEEELRGLVTAVQ